MHPVGSDALAVVDGLGVPAGRRHAVEQGGRAACADSRPRFVWPALSWDGADDAACRACAVALDPVAAYPAGPDAGPRAALMPWRPAVGLFETPGPTSS